MPRKPKPWFVRREGNSLRMTWRDHLGGRHRRNLDPSLPLDEAEKIAALMYAQLVEENKAMIAGALSLRAWSGRWLAMRYDLEPKTKKGYATSVRLCVEFLSNRLLNEYRREDFYRWRAHMAEQGASASTISKHLRHVRGVFNAAVKHEHLARCVVDVPMPPKTSKGHVSLAQLDAIFDACPSLSWSLLFGIARLAGLRANEILALRWAHVDLERRLLLIRPRATSTKKSIRDVPIVPQLRELLIEAKAAGLTYPTEGIAPEKMYRRSITPGIHSILDLAGVSGYGKPLHTLRGSCENDWKAEHSWPTVCQWLGHSPVVAMNHYLSPTQSEVDRATGLANDSNRQGHADLLSNDANELVRLRAENLVLAQRLAVLESAGAAEGSDEPIRIGPPEPRHEGELCHEPRSLGR